MNLIEIIEKEGQKENLTPFRVGDTVRVHFKIVEGTKERIQVFEGLVIARKNGGIRETFTVRKISFGVGVERTFPVHSPRIDKIDVVRQGDVARAKLYYIRDLSGKAATKVKEKRSADSKVKREVKDEAEKLAELKQGKAKATAKSTSKKIAAKPAVKKVTAADKRKAARAEARKVAKETEMNQPKDAAEAETAPAAE